MLVLGKMKSIRSRVPAPPYRCGRFPPPKRELDEGSLTGVACGIRTRVPGLLCEAAAKPKSDVLSRLDERDMSGALGDACSLRSAFGPLLRNVLIGFAVQSERAACRLQGGCSAC